MTTHAPTPADYAALRMRLDRFTGYREVAMHWPHVSIDAGPAALDGISVTEGGRSDAEAIAARATWWTRLVAPRREAEADAHDGRLEAYGRILGWRLSDPNPTGPVETWALFWRHADEPGVELTTEQLRARLAFDNPPCDFCGGHSPSRHVWPCSKCGGLGKAIPGWNPTTHAESVPQRDASHGARCGCEVACENCGGHAVPADVAAKRKVWPCSRCNGRGRHAQWECQWCGRPGVFGTGTVRDGRRDGQHDYDPGDRPPHWLYVPGADATTPEAAQRELAHRREQPDACGHPHRMFCGFKLVARAPLAETLHGEWDEPPDTSGHAGQAMGYVASGASRREPA